MFSSYGQPQFLRTASVQTPQDIAQVVAQPMEKMLVMCSSQPIIAFVSSDGLNVNRQYYRIEEIAPPASEAEISKRNMEALQSQIKAQQDQIAQLMDMLRKGAVNESPSERNDAAAK